MLAGFTEYLLHQFRCAVGDLGLVGERGSAVDEHAKLDDPFDPVERAQRRFHLRKQHDPATPRCRHSAIEIGVLAEPSFDQAAVFGEADLAGDVKQPARLDRRDVGGDGGGRLRQGDAEFGKAVIDAHAPPQALRQP